MKVDIPVLFLTLKETILVFPQSVMWAVGLSNMAFFYVKVGSLYSHFAESFYHE